MEGKCSVCSHASRGAIDHALVQRAPYRDIARRFGVSKDALARHVKAHLPRELARADEARRGEEADEVLRDARRIQLEAMLIFQDAKEDGLLKTALMALREARQTLALRINMIEAAELEKRIEELEEQIGGKAA